MEEVQKCINAMDFVKDWASWREHQLMKDLWDVATQEERKTLATLMFKLVQ